MSASRPRINSIKSTGSSQWGDPSRRPPSPTLSTTTTGSRIDFSHPPQLLITRADLRNSIGALTELVGQAKQYRQCLLSLSQATSAFASALEVCSRVKGCDSANAGILGASGLEYLIGNHDQLLADTFYREFEIPLLDMLDSYRASVTDRQAAYEKACQDKSHLIRKTEHENMKHGRRRKRDLQAFRAALTTLQGLVDDLDRLKSTYHYEVMDAEDELWNGVLDKVAYVARAKMDIHDKISSKSTDPSLQPLLSAIPDPFGSYDAAALEEGKIFSVLAPLSLMSTPKSPRPALSRTPDRVPTPPPQERIGGRPPVGAIKTATNEAAGNGPADVSTLSTSTKRRSFFGRLFQPSTENLNTSSGFTPGLSRPSARHARHLSQQSIASTAETFEDSDLDGAGDGTVETQRKDRDRQALMGRAVPGTKTKPDTIRSQRKGGDGHGVHAPIPNPRRVSGGNPGRTQQKDRRELSVIEDEDVAGDSVKEGSGGGNRTEIADEDDHHAEQSVKEGLSDARSVEGITGPSTITALGVPDGNKEAESISEGHSTPARTAGESGIAQEVDEIEEEHEREIPTAPPSPLLEHELEVMGNGRAER